MTLDREICFVMNNLLLSKPLLYHSREPRIQRARLKTKVARKSVQPLYGSIPAFDISISFIVIARVDRDHLNIEIFRGEGLKKKKGPRDGLLIRGSGIAGRC